jgi:branched-subunit amino acid transport protein
VEATLTLWLTILACGIVTFLARFSFIGLQGRVSVPDWFRRALTFVPVAVLSAISLPELLVAGEGLNLSLLNPRLLAGLVAVFVAWRTRNVTVTIVVGMLALWALERVFG